MKKLLITLTASAIALTANAGTTKPAKTEAAPSKTAEAAKATGKDAAGTVKGTAKNAATTTGNAAVGTAAGQVQFTGTGGFAAVGANRTVNLGGAAAPLTWGANGFLPAGAALILSTPTATGTLTFAKLFEDASEFLLGVAVQDLRGSQRLRTIHAHV